MSIPQKMLNMVQFFGIALEDSSSGEAVPLKSINGAASVLDAFKPSSYEADLTMDGTAQSVALATGVARIYVANQGATTEAIRVAFGTSAADAESNLNMTTDGAPEHATTGHYIGAAADVGSQSAQILGVPALATHYAIANAVDSDTQVVMVTQGV